MTSTTPTSSITSSSSQTDSVDLGSPDKHNASHSPPISLASVACQKDENSTQASVSFSKHLPTPMRPTAVTQSTATLGSATSLARNTIPNHLTKPLAKPPETTTTTGKTMSKSNLPGPPQSPPCISKPSHSIDANLSSRTKPARAGKRSFDDEAPATPTSPPPMKHHFLSTNAPLPSLPPTPRPLHPFHRHTSISGLLHSTTPAPSSTNSNDTLWQALCVRVLPLFNGEGVQGAVEDMNDLLRRCLSDPISPRLHHNVESLLHDGMFTLNTKLFGVTDEKLLDRLVEQWSFFFTYALPYFEAVFLPLRTDIQYLSADEAERWNVRNMALQSFRDNVILQQTKRLEDVFDRLFTDMGSCQNPVAAAAKMLQMVSLLASAPNPNEEMDRVLANLKTRWKRMMRHGGWGTARENNVLV
ncbi:hypothetical protein [Absidia glauca]|uniref:HbrB-like protein n=1 Tax=Absidia glauca TaxID=4829 RepID=A0A163JYA7_ABSGL|nr:hypothetical protein [Absidia glauca]